MFLPRFIPPSMFDPSTEIAAAVGKKLPVNTAKLVQLVRDMRAAGVKYAIGNAAHPTVGKVSSLSEPVSSITALDCSGFVRYALYQAGGGQIPDGSVRQQEWFARQGFAALNYQKTAGLVDNHLRIAFLVGHPGHVWMVLNGLTIESHGGVGPDRRAWNTPVLFKGANHCYLLT
jgi:hypothetical protein